MQVARSGGVILQSKSLVLSVKNLSVGYHDALVSGINLDVHVGEVIAVVGPSGIGKTTMLRTVAGLVKPISGKIDCNTPKPWRYWIYSTETRSCQTLECVGQRYARIKSGEE